MVKRASRLKRPSTCACRSSGTSWRNSQKALAIGWRVMSKTTSACCRSMRERQRPCSGTTPSPSRKRPCSRRSTSGSMVNSARPSCSGSLPSAARRSVQGEHTARQLPLASAASQRTGPKRVTSVRSSSRRSVIGCVASCSTAGMLTRTLKGPRSTASVHSPSAGFKVFHRP
jgi:hypothetical protein